MLFSESNGSSFDLDPIISKWAESCIVSPEMCRTDKTWGNEVDSYGSVLINSNIDRLSRGCIYSVESPVEIIIEQLTRNISYIAMNCVLQLRGALSNLRFVTNNEVNQILSTALRELRSRCMMLKFVSGRSFGSVLIIPVAREAVGVSDAIRLSLASQGTEEHRSIIFLNW